MGKRDIIQSLDFGHDVAEHEAKALAKYFVETDQWDRIFKGAVDVIYGAKGSGKSAIYHLMMIKEDEFYDRDILLVPVENPNEDPAFNELRSDFPPTEDEFIGLWKLYFCSVTAVRARDAHVKNAELDEVLEHLRDLKLIERDLSLNTIVKRISDYVKATFRPKSVSTTMNFDPISGGFSGVTGNIAFAEPNSQARDRGVRPIREILAKLNKALQVSGQTIWLLLDRLDVAFAGNEDLENRALRALFTAYKDMAGLDRIRPKLFIRADIWERIVAPGYREATHAASPQKSTTLKWDNSLLFNVFMKRLLQSDRLCEAYKIDRAALLGDAVLQDELIGKIFPDKVDTGKNPRTFAWICGRLEDGTGEATPRELIQFCSALRTEQLQRLEKATAQLSGDLLFERGSFKAALSPVSRNRLTKTIFAEYPICKLWLDGLRGKKSLQSADTLSSIWKTELSVTYERAELLVKIGVFRRSDADTGALYEIPILYRPSLQIIRGAEVGLRPEARRGVETDADDVDEPDGTEP